MRSFPTSGLGRACQDHLSIALPTQDIATQWVIGRIQHQFWTFLKAKQLKSNLVKGSHEALIHSDGLLNRHCSDATIDLEILYSDGQLLAACWSDSYSFSRHDRVGFHVQSNVRTVLSALGVHAWPLSGSRFAFLGADRIPIRAEEPELLLQVTIERTESVVASTAHFVMIQNQQTLRVGDNRAKLDLEWLMTDQPLGNNVFARLFMRLRTAEDTVHVAGLSLDRTALAVDKRQTEWEQWRFWRSPSSTAPRVA